MPAWGPSLPGTPYPPELDPGGEGGRRGWQVAVKQFTKKRLKAQRLKMLQSEVEVYLSLDHPHICRLLHAYEGRSEVWLIMELCGSELYTRLCQQKIYRESDAADVMRQMLQAVSYLHSHKIVHRDLKLENWMYGVADIDDRLKLIDFGFSQRLMSEDTHGGELWWLAEAGLAPGDGFEPKNHNDRLCSVARGHVRHQAPASQCCVRESGGSPRCPVISGDGANRGWSVGTWLTA